MRREHFPGSSGRVCSPQLKGSASLPLSLQADCKGLFDDRNRRYTRNGSKSRTEKIFWGQREDIQEPCATGLRQKCFLDHEKGNVYIISPSPEDIISKSRAGVIITRYIYIWLSPHCGYVKSGGHFHQNQLVFNRKVIGKIAKRTSAKEQSQKCGGF
jgi:hypothetical protein